MSFRIQKVRCKESGEEILIKDLRFDPEKHDAIERPLTPVKEKDGVELENEEETPESAPEGPGFECEACDKSFKTGAALKGHNTRYHSE